MKTEWDGYYYFNRTTKQFDDYLAQQNKRGRKRKFFKFEKVLLFKCKDECIVQGGIAVFRIPVTLLKGSSFYLETLKTEKAELIYEHKPFTFKDLMEFNSQYSYLCRKQPTLSLKDQ